MSDQRRSIGRVMAIVAVSAVCLFSVEALTSKVVPTVGATCLGRTDCTPAYPAVNCCNVPLEVHHFDNICQAQAACYYTCAEAPNYPPECHIDY